MTDAMDDGDEDYDYPDQDEINLNPCPTCRGGGTVNPLTAPEGFFCTGTTDCPDCEGTGEAY
jgi:DnaJ-class molecular chaperone